MISFAVMFLRLGSVLVAAALALSSTGCSKSKSDEDTPLRIAAAASLTSAFEAAGKAFETSSGHEVTFTFKASGKLAAQIAQGAPFDVFASADMSYVQDVIDSDSAIAETRSTFAVGRLVMWVPEGTPPASLGDLTASRFERIALANPDHAPYGAAARAALKNEGVWREVEKRLVFGSNVRQALQYGESGNADVALVALPLVLKAGGQHTPIDGSLHPPLEQGIVVLSHTKKRDEAQAFVDFLRSDSGAEILEGFGLAPPPATTAAQ